MPSLLLEKTLTLMEQGIDTTELKIEDFALIINPYTPEPTPSLRKWLLQRRPYPSTLKHTQWIDAAKWEDTKFWTEL